MLNSSKIWGCFLNDFGLRIIFLSPLKGRGHSVDAELTLSEPAGETGGTPC